MCVSRRRGPPGKRVSAQCPRPDVPLCGHDTAWAQGRASNSGREVGTAEGRGSHGRGQGVARPAPSNALAFPGSRVSARLLPRSFLSLNYKVREDTAKRG